MAPPSCMATSCMATSPIGGDIACERRRHVCGARSSMHGGGAGIDGDFRYAREHPRQKGCHRRGLASPMHRRSSGRRRHQGTDGKQPSPVIYGDASNRKRHNINRLPIDDRHWPGRRRRRDGVRARAPREPPTPSSRTGAPRCRRGSPPSRRRRAWWWRTRGRPDAAPTGSDDRCRA
jgi:hypothetical protein